MRVFVTSGDVKEEPSFGEKIEMIGDSVVRPPSNLEGERSALKLVRRFFGVDGSVHVSYAAMMLSLVIDFPPGSGWFSLGEGAESPVEYRITPCGENRLFMIAGVL